jgi:hypothetical protein
VKPTPTNATFGPRQTEGDKPQAGRRASKETSPGPLPVTRWSPGKRVCEIGWLAIRWSEPRGKGHERRDREGGLTAEGERARKRKKAHEGIGPRGRVTPEPRSRTLWRSKALKAGLAERNRGTFG